MPTRVQRIAIFAIMSLGALLSPANGTTTGDRRGPEIPELDVLTGRLAEGLHKLKAKHVAVFDFSGPEYQAHPAGKWLAQQLCNSLRTENSTLDVIGPLAALPDHQPSDREAYMLIQRAVKANRADVAVIGRFANLGQDIGITITIDPVRREQERIEITGVIPVGGEIMAVSPETIPSFRNGIGRAGTGGLTSAKCVKCPRPELPSEARRRHISGEVVLDAVVDADGSIQQLVVVRGLGYGIDESTIETVKKWKFKPAVDWQGKAVRASMAILASVKGD